MTPLRRFGLGAAGIGERGSDGRPRLPPRGSPKLGSHETHLRTGRGDRGAHQGARLRGT